MALIAAVIVIHGVVAIGGLASWFSLGWLLVSRVRAIGPGALSSAHRRPGSPCGVRAHLRP